MKTNGKIIKPYRVVLGINFLKLPCGAVILSVTEDISFVTPTFVAWALVPPDTERFDDRLVAVMRVPMEPLTRDYRFIHSFTCPAGQVYHVFDDGLYT